MFACPKCGGRTSVRKTRGTRRKRRCSDPDCRFVGWTGEKWLALPTPDTSIPQLLETAAAELRRAADRERMSLHPAGATP